MLWLAGATALRGTLSGSSLVSDKNFLSEAIDLVGLSGVSMECNASIDPVDVIISRRLWNRVTSSFMPLRCKLPRTG
jgi:hypothetical protein